MKKFNLPIFIGEIAFILIYSLIIFIAGSKDGFGSGSFILSYVLMIATGAANVLVVNFLANKYENKDKSVSDLGLIYPAEVASFLCFFALSLVFYITKPSSMKLSIILDCIVLILYVAYFVFAGYVICAQNKNRNHVAKKVYAIRNLVSKLDGAIDENQDPVIGETLEKLRDDVRFSDPMSSNELADIDNELGVIADEICELVSQKKVAETAEKIGQMSHLIKERNRKCKMLK